MSDTQPLLDPTVIDIDSMTDAEFEAYERTTLMAPDDMAEAMMDYMQFIRGDILHEGLVLPRFGLLTMKARRSPMYCYAHPHLKQRFPKSFNDGKHVFVSDDYMRMLIDAEERCYKEFIAEEKRDPRGMKNKRPKEGMVPLLLHHCMHMIMNHHKRFKGFPGEFTAIGADISVYSKLRLAFPDMEWVPELNEAFPASTLTIDEMKKYAKLSEETIIREVAGRYRAQLPSADEMLDQEAQDELDQAEREAAQAAKDAKDKANKDKKDKRDKKDEEESSDPSDDANDSDSDSDTNDDSKDSTQDKKKKDKKDKKDGSAQEKNDKTDDSEPGDDPSDDSGDQDGDDGSPSMDKDAMSKALEGMGMKVTQNMLDEMDGKPDTIDMKQMTSIAQENGLSATQKRLELPEAWDYDAIEKLEKETRLNDIDDISKSVKMAGKAGTMGGGHLEGAAHEEVIKETEGKLSWKMGLQEILGDSMHFTYSEAEAGDLYYVDPKDMGLNMEIFIGTDLPHKTEGVVMVLMDTSGSITEDLFKMFMSEIFGLIRNDNPESSTASEVVLLFCDDVIRGEPVLITEHNYEEMSQKKMEVYGRGGNDIGGTIKAAAKLPMFEEKKCAGIIYFTDLGDAPPVKSDVPEGVPLIFVCPPDHYQEEFIKAVKPFARVYPIEEGLEVDLTREGYLLDQGPKPKAAKRRFGF